MREQSRLHSLLETLSSIAIGFCVSLGITAVVLPAYGMPVSWLRKGSADSQRNDQNGASPG